MKLQLLLSPPVPWFQYQMIIGVPSAVFQPETFSACHRFIHLHSTYQKSTENNHPLHETCFFLHEACFFLMKHGFFFMKYGLFCMKYGFEYSIYMLKLSLEMRCPLSRWFSTLYPCLFSSSTARKPISRAGTQFFGLCRMRL